MNLKWSFYLNYCIWMKTSANNWSTKYATTNNEIPLTPVFFHNQCTPSCHICQLHCIGWLNWVEGFNPWYMKNSNRIQNASPRILQIPVQIPSAHSICPNMVNQVIENHLISWLSFTLPLSQFISWINDKNSIFVKDKAKFWIMIKND